MYKVLIVEDHLAWQDLLPYYVKQALKDPHITIARDFNEGSKLLTGAKWNLLITDIGLPPQPAQRLGIQLAERAHDLGVPSIAVSGTPVLKPLDVKVLLKEYGTEFFDKGSFDEKEFQQVVKKFVGGGSRTTDFLIITPMAEEFEAMRSKFLDLKKADDYQYKGSVECDNGTNYNVVISCLHSSKREIGPVQAAAATARWIEQWQPSNLLLEGIAAGVKGKVNLGDILIPAEIGDVTITTRTDNGERVIPKQRSLDKDLFDKCKVSNWEKLITISRPAKRGKVALHTGGCIISGSSKMQVADWTTAYQGVCEKLHGLEMEASGVMTALDRIVGKLKPKFMMIRAVSDFGGTNRKEEQDKWEKYACDVAASYTYAFLKSGPVPALNESS